MLSKEQVLEIISYCSSHGVQRKIRLKELGISEWHFYRSRRHYLRQEKAHPGVSGTFIQLSSEGALVPGSISAMEHRINPGRHESVRTDELTVECQTSRGGKVRIIGKVMASEYIQVDESVTPVLDNEKKTARELLGGYRGTFQSDGYEAYDQVLWRQRRCRGSLLGSCQA